VACQGRHAEEVIATERAPLGQNACRDRLAGSRRGHLACTYGGLPAVLAVDLRTEDGRLLLSGLAHPVRDNLVGQVVALSVGKNAFRYCRGWSVTAHGRVGAVLPDGSLPLELASLDGVTVVHPKQRSYP
jgi:hypothetical protein